MKPPTFPLVVRLTHWLAACALVVLAASGLQIFNAHPALYTGADSDPAAMVFSLPHRTGLDAQGRPHYEMVVAGRTIPTAWSMTAWPRSVTLGGWLAGGRRVHFATAVLLLATGLLYVVYMLASGRWRMVWPRKDDFRRLGPAVRAHLRFPPQLHEPGGGYNPLQKLAYAAVPLVLVPLLILTGLALSPQFDAIVPFYTSLFGGRQMARTLHFAFMILLGLFVVAHVGLVLASGWPYARRMVTGRPVEDPHA